jgi:Domain of unknown function (DUF4406)
MKLQPTLYISGPMTGLPQYNRAAFMAAERALALGGYGTVNPVHNGQPETAAWAQHMRADIALLVGEADAIALLPGWQNSRGAQLEIHIAQALGMPVKPLAEWLLICEVTA